MTHFVSCFFAINAAPYPRQRTERKETCERLFENTQSIRRNDVQSEFDSPIISHFFFPSTTISDQSHRREDFLHFRYRSRSSLAISLSPCSSIYNRRSITDSVLFSTVQSCRPGENNVKVMIVESSILS